MGSGGGRLAACKETKKRLGEWSRVGRGRLREREAGAHGRQEAVWM